MGWSDPLDASTLARQLRALSLLFSAQSQSQAPAQTQSLIHAVPSNATAATATATITVTASGSSGTGDMTLHMASLVPQIYQKLDALAGEPHTLSTHPIDTPYHRNPQTHLNPLDQLILSKHPVNPSSQRPVLCLIVC